jgi:hypothetical protein
VSLTDARRMWKLMNDAGVTGMHSHDLRVQGISGNPSQRAKDIVSKGQPVFTAREARNGRPGSRYWLQPYAPDFAVPVAPNGSEGGGGVSPPGLPTTPLSAVQPLGSAAASEDAESGAAEKERPRLTLVGDFWGDEPKWYMERRAA